MLKIGMYGKDHWSLLAYIETRCVDYGGVLGKDHMRCNTKKHFLQRGRHSEWRPEYGTRLQGYWNEDNTKNPDLLILDHDDWDCLEDLNQAGFVKIINFENGFVQLTEKGHELVNRLRKHKAEGKHYADFKTN